MELRLKNIGIIKDSSVKLDGLTVITGKNSSGKTTVGKVFYSLIHAGNVSRSTYELVRMRYMVLRLNEVKRILGFNRMGYVDYIDLPDNTPRHIQPLFELCQFDIFNPSYKDAERLYNEVKYCLSELSYNEYYDFLSFVVPEKELPLRVINRKTFEMRRERCQIRLEKADATLRNGDFESYRFNRINNQFNKEFSSQIKSVKNQKKDAHITLSREDELCIDILITEDEAFNFHVNSSFNFIIQRAFFVDDPFVVDELSDRVFKERDSLFEDEESPVEFVQSHRENLLKTLEQSNDMDYFEQIEFQKNYQVLFDKINEIIPGEFVHTQKGITYVNQRSSLFVQNLATGSKMFSIIKMLLLKNMLDDETALILDEPESHLHPEWINKFAEVLVLLVKEVGVNILLTTHSPNLLLALNVFSKEYEIREQSHFYLAREIENKNGKGTGLSEIVCIDENINEGYYHLSKPFLEMNRKSEMMKED